MSASCARMGPNYVDNNGDEHAPYRALRRLDALPDSVAKGVDTHANVKHPHTSRAKTGNGERGWKDSSHSHATLKGLAQAKRAAKRAMRSHFKNS